MIENFKENKSWRKILEELKQKISIFIGSKNLFNPSNFNSPFNPSVFVMVICFFVFGYKREKEREKKWKEGN